jgi:hypothetical protein
MGKERSMKKRYWIASIVGLILVLMSAIGVSAVEGTVVDWWVMAGGGAPSSGDSITMNGILGQPIVGPSSGGDVSLSAGYWVAGAEYKVYFPVVMR